MIRPADERGRSFRGARQAPRCREGRQPRQAAGPRRFLGGGPNCGAAGTLRSKDECRSAGETPMQRQSWRPASNLRLFRPRLFETDAAFREDCDSRKRPTTRIARLFDPNANLPEDCDIEHSKGKASRRNLRISWHLASISAIQTLVSASACRNLRHFWHPIRKAWKRAVSNRRNSRLSAKRCARNIERLAHRMRARIRRNALWRSA